MSRFPKAAEHAPRGAGPRRNVTPGTPVLAFRKGKSGGARAHWLHWGLAVPGRVLANARAETVAEKGVFGVALTTGRCAVPVDGFYEWRREAAARWPWYFQPAENNATGLLWLAGIGVVDEANGPNVCLLTTAANGVMAPVHHRMPVVLDEAGVGRWLAPGAVSRETLLALMAPSPERWLRCHPVSPAVNSATAPESPALTEPWVPPVAQGELF